jgi:hypothetical protein
MNPLISSTSVGYACITAIVLAIIFAMNDGGLSDEAALAVSAACQKSGQAMYVRITSSEIKAECVKP